MAATAAWRASIAGASRSGKHSQSRRRRRPMGVAQRPNTDSSEPSTCWRRRVRSISRLASVVASIVTNWSGWSQRGGRRCPSCAASSFGACVSRRKRSAAPAAARSGSSSSIPKPAIVRTPKCSSRQVRASSIRNVQGGRGVNAHPVASRMRSIDTGGVSSAVCAKSSSEGPMRTASSTRRAAGTSRTTNAPVDSSIAASRAEADSAGASTTTIWLRRPSSSSASSTSVPGVSTRVTARSTTPFASRGSCT